jgi:hypothetical protein
MNGFRCAILALAVCVVGSPAAFARAPSATIVTLEDAVPDPYSVFELLDNVVEVSPGTIVLSRWHGALTGELQILALRLGSIVWAESISVGIRHIVPSDDGGFFALTDYKAAPAGQNRADPLDEYQGVVRFGPDGRVVWAQLLRSRLSIHLAGLTAGPDGGIYIYGHLATTAGRGYRDGATPGNHEALALRLNAGGEIVWAKVMPASPGFMVIGGAEQPDGGVIIGADRLWRLNRDGAVIWSVQLEIDGLESSFDGLVATADGAIVGGNVFRPGRAGVDAFAISVDGSGSVRWATAVDVGPADRIERLAGTPGGGLLLVGTTHRVGRHLEDRVFPEEGWLVELDSHGALRRSVAVGSGVPTGGLVRDYINGAAATRDGGIAAFGGVGVGSGHHAFLLTLPATDLRSASPCALVKPARATTTSLLVKRSVMAAEVKDIELDEAAFQPTVDNIAISVAPICK